MGFAANLPDRSLIGTVPYPVHAGLTSLYLESRYEAQRLEMIDYKQKATYWEAQLDASKKRELALTDEIDELKAKLRKREQQLFGRKSEKKTATAAENTAAPENKKQKKPRGQQRNLEEVED